MGRIAVAGGSGALGRTFVEALSQAGHDVFILSRSERKSDSASVSYVRVDYNDPDDITTALEKHQIDTVISALNMIDETASQNQINLIVAADRSIVTKRFIPSEFGAVADAETAKLDPYVKYWIAGAEALEKATLQYSRISVGFFMDYWGMPHIKTEMTPYSWAIDIARKVASIPGTGNETLSMTYTVDIARFIVRLLEEDDWPKLAGFVGQDVTFNQILRWAEQARGGEKFSVVYDSIEKLEKGEMTPLDLTGQTPELPKDLSSVFGVMLNRSMIEIPSKENFRLNSRFPELKPLTVEEMIKNIWVDRK